MFNSIDEIKDFINKNGENKGDLYHFIEDNYYNEFEHIKFKQKEIIEREEHRWYELGMVVYEVYKDDISLGFLGIYEVIMMKSEMMTCEDIMHDITAYNVKEIVKKSFEIVKE